MCVCVCVCVCAHVCFLVCLFTYIVCTRAIVKSRMPRQGVSEMISDVEL